MESKLDNELKELAERNRILEEQIAERTRLDRLKDEFLANTSHELRTPLNGIIGLAESLSAGAAGPLTEQALANLGMISNSARRLNNLVNDILDLSRLKNMDIQLRRKTVDLRTLCDTVLTISGTLIHGKQLTLVNAIPVDFPAVNADEDRLQQILYNLVGNAIKFTDEGKVVISATTDNHWAEIAVTDTGIGIPADKLDDIFLTFAQMDTSAVRSHGGFGLGLGISRRLVELHGGGLRAESTVGSGSIFRFSMPVSSEATASPSAVTTVSSAGISTHSSIPLPLPAPDAPRILAVDDDPVNLQVLINDLGLEGMAVTTATNGIEALTLIETSKPFDLVLLDVVMPGMTGFEVCRRLRRRYNTAELPVTMLTAKNRLVDLTEGFACGANDYLDKPFTREELLAQVATQLKVRKYHELAQENSRLRRELIIDNLTGLTNRRGFDDFFDEEWRRALRSNYPISMMMIDIDFFKQYNDTYGHLKGDESLVQVANILKGVARRPGDVIARFGGEEFVILLPMTNAHNAVQIAEKTCRHVESLEIPHVESGISDYITISIGVVTVLPRQNIPQVDVIKTADEALYRAKSEGRNRVVFMDSNFIGPQ
jgi:diguanylate cyclase (GGDEF)-like protein